MNSTMRELPEASDIADNESGVIIDSLEPFDLAVLEFTHPFQFPNTGFLDNQWTIFITKAAYKWPVILDYMIASDEKKPEILINAYFQFLCNAQNTFDKIESFLLFREEVPDISKIGSSRETPFLESMFTIMNLSEIYGDQDREKMFSRLYSSLNHDYREISPPTIPKSFLEQRIDRIEELQKKGYLRDPILEIASGTTIAALGMVPYSYSKRTEDGDKVTLKIRAIMWEMEYERKNNAKSLELHFKMTTLISILKNLFKKYIEITEEKEK